MRSLAIACFLFVLTANASAQAVSPQERLREINAQRVAIGGNRATLEAGFQAEDAACQKKFAVNRCLNDVNLRRRETMADLRSQETFLNDEERKMRGAEQIRKTEEKLSPEKHEEAVSRSIKANDDHRSRLERETSKMQERAKAESNEKTAQDANAEKLLRNQKKAEERRLKQAAAAEAEKKYAERQAEARKRRAEHDAERAKPGKPPAKPLPIPAQ